MGQLGVPVGLITRRSEVQILLPLFIMNLILGIDEAGRGPVIGPLVMAGVLIEEEKEQELKGLGVKDSKLINPKRRVFLFDKIRKLARRYDILIIDPKEIDDALNSDSLNLNWLEANKTVELINRLKPNKVILDCPSPNVAKYRRYVYELLDDKNIDIVSEHKADLKYPVVSAASILAKVTRDREIEKIKKKYGDIGPGYSSNPITQKFLKENWNKHPEIFRKSWISWKNHKNAKNQKKLDDFKAT